MYKKHENIKTQKEERRIKTMEENPRGIKGTRRREGTKQEAKKKENEGRERG